MINSIEKKLSVFKDEEEKIRKEVQKRTLGYITAAFGFIAGLAWNDAIKAFIEYLYPLEQSTVKVKFAYALIMTLVLVIISMYLARLFKEGKNEENKG